jgi:hypothetical protein
MPEKQTVARGVTLADVVERQIRADKKLNKLVAGVDSIMATLQEVQQKLDGLTSKVGEIGPALGRIGQGIDGVANDIQTLKLQVGSGTPGITPAEADGVVAQRTTMGTALGEAVTGLNSAADMLQGIASEQ